MTTPDSTLNEFDNAGDNAFTAPSVKGNFSEPMYSGALSFLRRQYTRDLNGVDVAVTGVPFDLATSSRSGSRLGPQAIRRASANLAWNNHYPSGIDVVQTLAIVDYGDLVFNPGFPHTIPLAISQHAEKILAANCQMVTMGGDHYISYPLLRAHAQKHGPLAMIQFDAHCDTWAVAHNPIDHGSMFYQAIQDGLIIPEKTVQIGIRTHNPETMGVHTLDARHIHQHSPENIAQQIQDIVGSHPTYLSFDIDCLDPAYAPGTGTPVCGGLATYQAQTILGQLQAIKFIGMDIVEVSPAYDHADITALAAANIIFDYLALLANR